MPRERPIAVELEIDESWPLSGRLREHGGSWTAFAGWIGLAGAIDGVLEPGDRPPATGQQGIPTPPRADAPLREDHPAAPCPPYTDGL